VSHIFAIVFSLLLVTALFSIYSNFVMRFRLTKRESSRDKLVWWRVSSDKVGEMYQELFPKSFLPLSGQFTFWLLIAVAFVVLFAAIWKRL